MSGDQPYLAEYAKSGRAACKGCKEKIDQGVLRIAVMVQSAFHDGKQPNWHHEECFFKKQRPKAVNDIGKLNTLRNSDQKRIKEAVENSAFAIVLPKEKGKGKGKGKRAHADSNAAALRDFAIEYSKSSRATCRVCEIKICKDEVRISKTVYDTEVGQKFGGQPLWHHVKCFAEVRVNLLFLAGGEDLPGFKALNKEDKDMVKAEIKTVKSEVPIKKLKSEPKDEADIIQEKKLEKKMEKQNDLFFKYRSALSSYPKKELQQLLEANDQAVCVGFDDCLVRAADMMAFGALQPCAACAGQLQLETYGYKCSGYVSDWVKCTDVTQNPKRRPMKVPKAFADSSAFAKYKPKVGVRLFEVAPPPPLLIVKNEDPLTNGNGVKKERPAPPLKNLQFFIYGKTKSSKEEIKNRILKLGGLVVGGLPATLAAVVAAARDVRRLPAKMQEIQEKDFEVVEETFFDLIDPSTGSVAKTLELIKEHNIAEWGSDPAKRVPQDVIDGKSIPKSGSLYVKSGKSSKTTLKLKGGAAVEPASGLQRAAHVFAAAAGARYCAVLGRADVLQQKNSYYKLQLLEADNKKKYWLFRSWGRIGTTIGSSKLEACKSLDEAISQFEDCYMERTGNPWELRDQFTKVPGRYAPVDVDYGEAAAAAAAAAGARLAPDAACALPMPVQQLIVKIFDIDVMKKTLLEFELDTEKMPLGKLSKKQIKAGYKVLSELLKHLENGQSNQHKIIEGTNNFYTLIPHDCGVRTPPLLASAASVQAKAAMLDNMLEIEIAYSLLKTDSEDNKSPIESHYLRLKCELVPLERGGEEWELLQLYARSTHAATHHNYELEMQQVFKVTREGEERRYKPFKKLHNRKLLWHGSRITNFAGILSQGLRIAPPEAPVTGYMFGKGIYFADMVSKSANYCCTSRASPEGVLLLCEVALGNMMECTAAKTVTSLPAGTHSVWGRGRTAPGAAASLPGAAGCEVPLGPPVVHKDLQTSLLYNEYIVYDVAQVNVKYLLQMKFNYK